MTHMYVYIYILAWARALNARRNHETEHTKTWHIKSESTRSRTPGLGDARTQRWTFCEPCSMEQNVQVQGEHCQHGKTIEHVWKNAKMQKHRASKATVLTMSFDWEPHAKPDRWTQRKWLMTSSLSKKESIQTQQKRSTQRGCTINEMGGCRHVC